jgi:hypothetical protein
MDLQSAAIAAGAFILGGVFNALVAAATAEYHARQDEGRQARRAREDRLRTERLEELEKVKRAMYSYLIYVSARASGNSVLAVRSGYPQKDLLDEFPRYDLLGDEELLRDYFELTHELAEKKSGTGMSRDDLLRWGDVEGRLLRCVMEQRERILNDEGINMVDWRRVGELEGGYERALERHRIETSRSETSPEPRTE